MNFILIRFVVLKLNKKNDICFKISSYLQMNLELTKLVEKITSSREFTSIGKQNRDAFMKLIDDLALQGNDGIKHLSVYPEVTYYNYRAKNNITFRHRLLEKPALGEAWTPPSTEESYGLSDVMYAKMVFNIMDFDYKWRNI